MKGETEKFKLKREKIPTPTEFILCPLCNEPLKFQWEDEFLRGFYICRNPNCEVNAVELKK